MQEGQGYNPWMGAAFGGIPGMAGMFMQNPTDSAMNYYNQIPGMVHGAYNPYIHAGMNAMGNLQTQYGNLLNNPTGMMNKIGQSYQQSPGFNYMKNMGMQGINNAAAAGGMLGSPQNQMQAGQLAGNLANQDYYNYVDRGLNQYGMGLEGEQGLNQMGFNATNNMAGLLASTLMNQGNLAYQGQNMQNQMWGNMAGAGMSMAGAFL